MGKVKSTRLLPDTDGTQKPGDLFAEEKDDQEVGQGHEVQYAAVKRSATHGFFRGAVICNFTAHGTLRGRIVR